MMNLNDHRPRLRPGVEAGQFAESPEGTITLYDSTGLTPAAVHVSPGGLWLIGLMDGSRTLADIQSEYHSAAGQSLDDGILRSVVHQMDQARLLESPSFEAHYSALVERYRTLPARPSLAMGLPTDGNEITRLLDEILAGAPTCDGHDGIVGLVAPHLDYARGGPCYAAAYARIARRAAPARIIILGTNHSPRTFAPVATSVPYETPLGRLRLDVPFIESLEARCGDLRRCELDHAREHSVELQTLWCQHLFGADRFELVPIICADPSTPRGLFPNALERSGAAEVGHALAELLAEDPKDTLVIAGADLSHVGRTFGSERLLDDQFLSEVRQRDAAMLKHVEANGAEAFLGEFAAENNPTNVCSVGCIYVLMKALPHASAAVIRYHQAVDQAAQTCVTCAAAVLTK